MKKTNLIMIIMTLITMTTINASIDIARTYSEIDISNGWGVNISSVGGVQPTGGGSYYYSQFIDKNDGLNWDKIKFDKTSYESSRLQVRVASNPTGVLKNSYLLDYWQFNNTNDLIGINGNIFVKDSGIIQNDTGIMQNYNSIEFDGLSTELNLTTDILNGLDEGTISFWVKPNYKPALEAGILGTRYPNPSNYIQFNQDTGGNFKVMVKNDIDGEQVLTQTAQINQWNHLVFSWDSNGMYFQVNDNSIGTDTDLVNGLNDSMNNLHLGYYYSSGNRWFNGSVSNLAIYNKKYSMEELNNYSYFSGDGVVIGSTGTGAGHSLLVNMNSCVKLLNTVCLLFPDHDNVKPFTRYHPL